MSEEKVTVDEMRKALATFSRLNVGDFIYSIRESERVLMTTPEGVSTWEHEDVKAWSDAAVVADRVAKEQTKERREA